jgi:hypothetical protein
VSDPSSPTDSTRTAATSPRSPPPPPPRPPPHSAASRHHRAAASSTSATRCRPPHRAGVQHLLPVRVLPVHWFPISTRAASLGFRPPTVPAAAMPRRSSGNHPTHAPPRVSIRGAVYAFVEGVVDSAPPPGSVVRARRFGCFVRFNPYDVACLC